MDVQLKEREAQKKLGKYEDRAEEARISKDVEKYKTEVRKREEEAKRRSIEWNRSLVD